MSEKKEIHKINTPSFDMFSLVRVNVVVCGHTTLCDAATLSGTTSNVCIFMDFHYFPLIFMLSRSFSSILRVFRKTSCQAMEKNI